MRRYISHNEAGFYFEHNFQVLLSVHIYYILRFGTLKPLGRPAKAISSRESTTKFKNLLLKGSISRISIWICSIKNCSTNSRAYFVDPSNAAGCDTCKTRINKNVNSLTAPLGLQQHQAMQWKSLPLLVHKSHQRRDSKFYKELSRRCQQFVMSERKVPRNCVQQVTKKLCIF